MRGAGCAATAGRERRGLGCCIGAPAAGAAPHPSLSLPQADDIESLNYDDLKAVAKLNSSPGYQDVMARVAAALEAPPEEGAMRMTATLEDDPTYK